MVAPHCSDDNVMPSPVFEDAPISFFIGIIAGMSRLNPSWAAATVIGFEAAMIILEEASITAPFKRDTSKSVGTMAVDTIAGIYGVYLGEYLRARKMQQKSVPLSPQIVAPDTTIQEEPMAVAGWSQRTINKQFPLVRTAPILGVRHVSKR